MNTNGKAINLLDITQWQLSPYQILVLGFTALILCGALLLMLYPALVDLLGQAQGPAGPLGEGRVACRHAGQALHMAAQAGGAAIGGAGAPELLALLHPQQEPRMACAIGPFLSSSIRAACGSRNYPP